jgi:Protein of unknown function (DUF1566)
VTYTFNEAANYAAKLNREKYLGHDDWRVPTKGELNVLFHNHAAIGGFETGLVPAEWYWSSSLDDDIRVWTQGFNNGRQSPAGESLDSSLRLVR